MTTDVTLPTTSGAPAELADMPADVTVSTRNVPAVVPTADPRAAATASIMSASGARPALRRRATAADTAARPLDAGSRTSASAAQATKAQRQSTRTTMGTAKPHSSVAIGFAAPFIPDAPPPTGAGAPSARAPL